MPHQPAHSFVRELYLNSPFWMKNAGMSVMQIGFVHTFLLSSRACTAGFVTFADDVVASVRRMYADDYALVKRLAGFDLDELLANATSA